MPPKPRQRSWRRTGQKLLWGRVGSRPRAPEPPSVGGSRARRGPPLEGEGPAALCGALSQVREEARTKESESPVRVRVKVIPGGEPLSNSVFYSLKKGRRQRDLKMSSQEGHTMWLRWAVTPGVPCERPRFGTAEAFAFGSSTILTSRRTACSGGSREPQAVPAGRARPLQVSLQVAPSPKSLPRAPGRRGPSWEAERAHPSRSAHAHARGLAHTRAPQPRARFLLAGGGGRGRADPKQTTCARRRSAPPPRGLRLVRTSSGSRGHLGHLGPHPSLSAPRPRPREALQGYIGPGRRWRREGTAAGRRGDAAREAGGGKAAAGATAAETRLRGRPRLKADPPPVVARTAACTVSVREDARPGPRTFREETPVSGTGSRCARFLLHRARSGTGGWNRSPDRLPRSRCSSN